MSPNEYVKYSILNYPSLYKNRFDVLRHLFTSGGGGHWGDDGELHFTFPDDMDLERTTCKRDFYKSGDIKDKLEHHLLGFIDANIDEIASEKVFACSTMAKTMEWCHWAKSVDSYGNKFFNTPENITPEWKEVHEEWGSMWKHFFFVRNDLHAYDCIQFSRDNRGMFIDTSTEDRAEQADRLSDEQRRDMKCYNTIVEKLESMKTPEEKELRKKRSERACKIIEEILVEEN